MSRYDQILRDLKEALSNPQLYSDEEIRYMKTEYRNLLENKQQLLKEGKNGFGS